MANARLPQRSSVPQDGVNGRFWATRAVYGLGLGAVVAALEFAHYSPLLTERNEIGLNEFVLLLLEWCGEFAILSLVVGIVESRERPRELGAWKLAFTVVVGAFAGVLIWSAAMDFVLRDLLRLGLFVDHVGQPVEWAGRIIYHAWMVLFFGGLAVAAEVSQRRHMRMLVALRAAELGRATSQQQLAEITLGSLQARIDPEFVFETLSKLEALYETDPPEADRLLEELIAFLHQALADIQASGALAAPDHATPRDVSFQPN
jgi:hypothetical protein